MDPTNQASWKNIFCGRKNELQFLIDKWRLVSDRENPSPQVAILLGEGGIGKTRIVQKFYEWLADNEDHDGYWPETLNAEDNLEVNPDIHSIQTERKLPYLWWALRFSDPLLRNGSLLQSALASHMDPLAIHFAPLYRARYKLEQTKQVSLLLMSTVTLNISNYVTNVIDGATLGVELVKQWREKNKEYGIEQHRQTRLASVLKDIQTALQPPKQSIKDKLGLTFEHVINVPFILFLDDAQWADEESLNLVTELVKFSQKGRWPLLIIATHWEREWQENITNESRRSFARVMSDAVGDQNIQDSICVIDNCENLDDIICAALPGIDEKQRSILLEASGMNPHLLHEMISTVLHNRHWFVGRNRMSSLTNEALDNIRKLEQSDFVDRRFTSLPENLQDFLSIGSVQGSAFNDILALSTFKRMWRNECEDDIAAKAENPYKYVKKTSIYSSEFRGRLHYIRAKEGMSESERVEALEFTRQDIERIFLDGRWERLDEGDRIRLRSFYITVTDEDYQGDFPDVWLLIFLEHLADSHEINEPNLTYLDSDHEIENAPYISDVEIEYEDHRWGTTAISVRRSDLSEEETLTNFMRLSKSVYDLYDSFIDRNEGFYYSQYYDALRSSCLKCLDKLREIAGDKYNQSMSKQEWLSSFAEMP